MKQKKKLLLAVVIVLLAGMGIFTMCCYKSWNSRRSLENQKAWEDSLQNKGTQKNEFRLEMQEAERKDKLFLHSFYDSYAVLVDEDGQAERYEFTDRNGNVIKPIEAICEEAENIYYISRDYQQENGWINTIYKIDCEQRKQDIVAEKDGDCWRTLEAYQGKVYSLQMEEKYNEKVYVSAQNDGNYQETFENQAIYDLILQEGYRLIWGWRTDGRCEYYTIPYCIKTFGKILVWDEQQGAIVVLNEKGRLCKKIFLDQESTGIVAILGNDIIYWTKTGEWVVHNLRTQEEEILKENVHSNKWRILGFSEEKIYYAELEEVTFGVERKRIYRYDIGKKEEKLLYEAWQQPGIDWQYSEGIPAFHADGEKCYYLGTDGKNVEWMVLEEKDDMVHIEPLGVVSKHYEFADYGTITCESISIDCPFCGVLAYEIYTEMFVLDEKYPNANKINQELLNQVQEHVNVSVPSDEMWQHYDEEGYHNEYFATETRELKVNSVQMLGTHYISVNYEGEDYYGGAHGFPYRAQDVFDLNTGEKVYFSDFYTGSQEEFKKIVAEYTVQDWKEHPEEYYSTDEEALYKEALYKEVYETANVDMYMELYKNGIVIVYAPYRLGPFSSGHICIEIPYEVLGIEIS